MSNALQLARNVLESLLQEADEMETIIQESRGEVSTELFEARLEKLQSRIDRARAAVKELEWS